MVYWIICWLIYCYWRIELNRIELNWIELVISSLLFSKVDCMIDWFRRRSSDVNNDFVVLLCVNDLLYCVAK